MTADPIEALAEGFQAAVLASHARGGQDATADALAIFQVATDLNVPDRVVLNSFAFMVRRLAVRRPPSTSSSAALSRAYGSGYASAVRFASARLKVR